MRFFTIVNRPLPRRINRGQNQNRPPTNRTASGPLPSQPKGNCLLFHLALPCWTSFVVPQPSLTTEYTPIQRGGPVAPSQSQSDLGAPSGPTPVAQPQPQPQLTKEPSTLVQEDGVDTSTLPPVQAPPSHPLIDPSATGTFDGRSILDLDLNAMADKPWRRPGSDISDWFNYGFDELSWEAYCYRRRDLGEIANVLKTNVIVSIYFVSHITMS